MGEPPCESVLVLHGPPGVGKSELAREFARVQGQRYPGGTFFVDASADAAPVDLARIGETILDLNLPEDLPIDDQCLRALLALAAAPSLLIYDNVRSPEAIVPWLPPAGMPCHVLVTSVVDRWDAGWLTLAVEPLSLTQSRELIERVADREVADRYGARLASLAGGLPVQLVPASVTLAYEKRRGRLDAAALTLTREANESFLGVYAQLERPVQLMLHAAAFLTSQHIPREELNRHLAQADNWSEAEYERRLDACLDLHLLEGGADLRMHQLFASFVLATPISPEVGASLQQVRSVQGRRLVELASELAASPNEAELAATLMVFPLDPWPWAGAGAPVSIEDGEQVGRALYEIGRFEAARPWFERAAAAKEKGNAEGRVDHPSLGYSLHQVGYCLSSMGQYDAARPWFERAVAAGEKGDIQGRVDHGELGKSLHQAGVCLSSNGQFDAARSWYERAVEAKEKGDINGRIDHRTIGLSLHQVGYCLSSMGQHEAARPWYERSVEAREKGNIHGRVDHDDLGRGLHQVGVCVSSTGQYEAARPWYERAVAAKEKGDIHGRVDYGSLGYSLRQVGYCLSSTGQFEAARPWYERSVEAKEKGDIHGRVNYDSLGRSLQEVGYCLSSMDQYGAARSWYERAVEAHEKGDIHGRIDQKSLGVSLRGAAKCLRKLGQTERAKEWEDRASGLEAK